MKKSVGFLGALFLSFTAIATADGLGDETIRLAVEKNLEKAHVTFGGGPFGCRRRKRRRADGPRREPLGQEKSR